ncbi:hypothetical protein LCGC14_3002470, partial [marine sediment metagenome]
RWGSEELQSARLEVMARIVKRACQYERVLDVGCGLGELAMWLGNYSCLGPYRGIDLVEELITEAKTRFDGRKYRFETHDLRDEPRPADAVIASGIFALCNDRIFWSMLDAMWESAEVVMAFNCKSSWAPENSKYLGKTAYFRDPAETLAQCRTRYTRNLILDHSYLDHDFTIGMHKGGK